MRQFPEGMKVSRSGGLQNTCQAQGSFLEDGPRSEGGRSLLGQRQTEGVTVGRPQDELHGAAQRFRNNKVEEGRDS